MSAHVILIADAELEIRRFLEAALHFHGYEVRFAQDGAEAIEILTAPETDISLALVNLFIPRVDGFQILRAIRRQGSTLPAILYSGSDSAALREEALRSGAALLRLPFSHADLVGAIRATLQQEPEPVDALVPSGHQDVFFCSNPRMQAIRLALKQIALSDAPVIIYGESGVGKEVLARELHAASPRAAKPFQKLNCAAVPSELLESELFGYERGAFTGAFKNNRGKFEAADGGTMLLDEIGDMDVKLQAKLLHVLQDHEFQRLGGRETVRVNVRVFAATHRDLKQAIQEGRFREDLYYRLNVISLQVPPLRERADEILPLAGHFLGKYLRAGDKLPEIGSELQSALLAHPWPGNIRELENTMRRLLVFNDQATLAQELRGGPAKVDGPQAPVPPEPPSAASLEDVNKAWSHAEAAAIREALEATHWNRKRAAELLQIDYKALLYKLKKHGVVAQRNGPGKGLALAASGGRRRG